MMLPVVNCTSITPRAASPWRLGRFFGGSDMVAIEPISDQPKTVSNFNVAVVRPGHHLSNLDKTGFLL
jgi:hypothetical protein